MEADGFKVSSATKKRFSYKLFLFMRMCAGNRGIFKWIFVPDRFYWHHRYLLQRLYQTWQLLTFRSRTFSWIIFTGKIPLRFFCVTVDGPVFFNSVIVVWVWSLITYVVLTSTKWIFWVWPNRMIEFLEIFLVRRL